MSRSVSAPSSVTNTSPCWNGDMVPGSTLRYGSSLIRVTLRPRDSRIAAKEAEAIPLPREDTTPPVTKTNLVMSGRKSRFREVVKRNYTGTGKETRERGQGRRGRKGFAEDAEETRMKVEFNLSTVFFASSAKSLRPLRPAVRFSVFGYI